MDTTFLLLWEVPPSRAFMGLLDIARIFLICLFRVLDKEGDYVFFLARSGH